ncbi:hypothetical protein NIES4101_78380 [Calothrix sp. NIES-4101]|nr:hypothetical protein NIES4101_78380 [Calothrix sp. NIES-4101]
MTIIICPGIHAPALTDKFVSQLLETDRNSHFCNDVKIIVFPSGGILPISGLHLWEFLHQNIGDNCNEPITLISFSAGVIGAFIAACLWELQGGKIRAFIAIDGWGVPLFANFPIYRLSHDYFTHWSSLLLGGGEVNFYAEPSVSHLELWENFKMVKGYQINHSQIPEKTYLNASDFLHLILQN